MAGKTFSGTVTSNKMTKTLVVSVGSRSRDPLTGKTVSHRRKFKVHSENSEIRIGDTVEFIECRPISKDKKFRLTKLLIKSEVAANVNEELV